MATKYCDNFPDQLREMATDHPSLGLTNQDIADLFGVSAHAIKSWIKKYEAFSEAVREVKDDRDRQVTESLFARAVGLSYDERKIVKNAKGQIIREEIIEKRVLPDTTAMIFWLKNRRPDLWADVQKHEFKGVTWLDIVANAERAECAPLPGGVPEALPAGEE